MSVKDAFTREEAELGARIVGAVSRIKQAIQGFEKEELPLKSDEFEIVGKTLKSELTDREIGLIMAKLIPK